MWAWLKKLESSEGEDGNNVVTVLAGVGAAGAAVFGGLFNVFIDDDDEDRGARVYRESAWTAQHQQFFKKDYADRVFALTKNWRFNPADEADFAAPEFDDSAWTYIDANDAWEGQIDADYDGIAWYRKTLNLKLVEKRPLYLVLGRIDDCDETYFNGVLIGRTGTFPAEAKTAWDSRRVYAIPPDLVRPKGPNVVAIRVYDQQGPGGLVGEGVGIYASRLPAPELDLNGEWQIARNEAKPEQPPGNDATWSTILAPGRWDHQGWGDFDGTAWYRKSFEWEATTDVDQLELNLGQIDDRDEVFLNGTKVGETWGSREDDDSWAKQRRYPFPAELLKSGENELLVKVNDYRQSGGIHAGPLGIMTVEDAEVFWAASSAPRPVFQTAWNWLLGRD